MINELHHEYHMMAIVDQVCLLCLSMSMFNSLMRVCACYTMVYKLTKVYMNHTWH